MSLPILNVSVSVFSSAPEDDESPADEEELSSEFNSEEDDETEDEEEGSVSFLQPEKERATAKIIITDNTESILFFI